MEGNGLENKESSSLWGNSQTQTQQPQIRLFRRVKMVPEEILVGEREEPEVEFDGLSELFAGLEYGKRSQFQKRVSEVKKINRVTNGDKSPT